MAIYKVPISFGEKLEMEDIILEKMFPSTLIVSVAGMW